MSDTPATSHPAEEKEPSKKAHEEEDPKQHGSGASEDAALGGEANETPSGTSGGTADS